jgi:enamine deaminase RidA (YjgF/YER057c/UK114 family)
VEGGAGPQTEQALRNLEAILQAAGSGLDRIVKVTIFLDDANTALAETSHSLPPRVAQAKNHRIPVMTAVRCGSRLVL